MSVPEEIEAKLLAPRPATLTAIARVRHFGDYRLVPLPTQRLHTVYLDAEGLPLTRSGLALRARRRGRVWEMTVKWQGRVEDDVHRRPELTVPLPSAPGAAVVVDDPEVRRHLACRLLGRPLGVVLISDIVRRRLAVVRADAAESAPLAEIALDRVYLHRNPGEPEERYCEVEIEALADDASVVRAVASALRQSFDLMPSADTKFARGMQLLHGSEVLQVAPRGLTRDDTAVAAGRKLVAAALDRLQQEDPRCRLADDPEAIHDMRVVLRRLRAALKTMPSAWSSRWCASTSSELRWLAKELGALRDLDVHAQRVAAFAEVAPPALRASVAELLQRATSERPAQVERVRSALDSRRYEKLLVRLEQHAEQGLGQASPRAAGGLLTEVAADAIDKAFRRLRRWSKHLAANPRPEELHELRIRVKRARYVVELFAPLLGKPARRVARRLAALQDHLGTYQDAVVGADFVHSYVDTCGDQLTPATMLGLGALLGAELSTAQVLRSELPRRWRRVGGKRMRRAVAALLESLRAGREVPSKDPSIESGRSE